MRKSPSSITNNLIPREEDESVYYRTIYSTGHSLDGPVPFRLINYRVNRPDHVLYKYSTKNRVNGNTGPFIDNRLGFGLGNQNYACHSTTFFKSRHLFSMAIWLPHTPRPKMLVSYLLLKLTMFEIPGGIREIGGQKSMGMGRVTPQKKLYGICNCQGLNERTGM